MQQINHKMVRLQILGSANGHFANVDYQPDIKERDFYIFPYDMRHCVYPFNGPGYEKNTCCKYGCAV